MQQIKLGLIGIPTATAPPYTADQFEAQLAKCDPAETVYLDIHSEGGSVFEGFRIGNAIADWPGKVVARIKVAAFSIASYIAVKCDEIEIAENGFFMIHNPYSETSGDDESHAKQGQLLAELKESMIKSYAEKTGLGEVLVKEMMKAETYIGSQKAIELGFANRIIENTKEQRQLPTNHLPSFVYAAMYGSTEVSEPAATPKPKEVIMSESSQQPVAATVSAIKKAFPKATSDFVVKCMEEEMNMEDVGEEYAKAMEEENETLKAQLAELQEEMAKLKAMEEEEAPMPEASGIKPVAHVSGGLVDNPQAKWNEVIESYVAKGKTRQQAHIAANRAFPNLRAQLIAQANN